MFVVWAQPGSGAPRAKVLAADLGIPVYYIYYSSKCLVLKFIVQFVKTMDLLLKHKPDLVFIQVGPVVALLPVYLYALWFGKKFIIDCHSGVFTIRKEMIWLPLLKLLARRAECLLIHNKKLAEKLRGWPVQYFVLEIKVPSFDELTTTPFLSPWNTTDHFKVAVINTFRPDEPLREIIQAAQLLPNVRFFITGKIRDFRKLTPAPPNVTYTDFLADEEYVSLLYRSDVVMVLTTREYTAQYGAYEAIAVGKPVITSGWDALRQLYYKGTVFVENTPESIADGIRYAMTHKERLEKEIRELRAQLNAQWLQKKEWLVKLITEALNETTCSRF
jgi:glycosyltransferase involved in cell wall biosynthesis